MLPVPDTAAKNCCELSVPVDGGRNAYGGEIATDTGAVGPAMVMTEAPLCDGSAWLVAKSVTGLAAGSDAGAM